MVIDLILNREDGQAYEPRTFYRRVREYSDVSPENGTIGNILDAMDNGEEADVKHALHTYIDKNGYNPDIPEWNDPRHYGVGCRSYRRTACKKPIRDPYARRRHGYGISPCLFPFPDTVRAGVYMHRRELPFK